MNKFYVYCHRRKTDGKCFYIGKGTNDRAYTKYGRNKHWLNIINKHGFEAIILVNNINEEKAFELESNFCKQIGYENLCNIREENGWGGYSHSENSKIKQSNSMLGKKHTQQTKDKISKAKLGFKTALGKHWKLDKPFSILHKEKISIALKGKPKSEEHKNKLKKPKSEEHKKNMSKAKYIPILQYDLEGNFIKEWSSIMEAINQTGYKGIRSNLRKTSRTSGGFIWKYK